MKIHLIFLLHRMMKYICQSCILVISCISVCQSLRFYTSVNYEYDDKHVSATPEIGRMHLDRTRGVISPIANHTASIIFLHDLGNLGISMIKKFATLQSNFETEGIKVIFPTSPIRPVTALKTLYHVWFDVTEMNFNTKELLHTFEQNYKDLKALIQEEYEAGIPMNKIFIGGIRQGGTMAMHIALRVVPEIRGIFVFDSYLSQNSIVFKELRQKLHKQLPELLWIHSKSDGSLKFAKNQAEDLKRLGVKTEFITQNPKKDIINQEVLDILWAWIKSKLMYQ